MIGIGIIARLVLVSGDDTKLAMLSDTLQKMQTQCNFVCGTTKGNLLSIDVEIPKNIELYSTSQKICLKYNEKSKCVACNCDMEEYSLKLDTKLAQEFDVHKFKCYFERLERSIQLNCQG